MKTETAHATRTAQAPPHAPSQAPPQGSPLRLIILLSVLLVVGGALLYDWVIAPPRVKAAYDNLRDKVLQFNAVGIKAAKNVDSKEASAAASGLGAGLLYSEDIQKIMGMPPTKVEKTEHYTIEHYRWWGWIPRNRNFITVLYIGDPEKPHYSTHYANELPENGVIPGKKSSEPPIAVASKTDSTNASTPSGASSAFVPASLRMPRMNVPEAGMPGGGGGKGKGRPQGSAGSKGTPAPDVAKKSSDSAKAGEPKKEGIGEEEKKAESKESK